MRGYNVSERETWRRCCGCRYMMTDNTCGFHLTGKTRLSLGIKGSPCELFDGVRRGKQLALLEKRKQRASGSRKYPPEIFEALYDKGMGDREIARALGCAVSTVHTWRKQNNKPIKARGKPGPKTALREVYDEKAGALFAQGMTDQEIANVLGGSRSMARDWRNRNGIQAQRGRRKGETK